MAIKEFWDKIIVLGKTYGAIAAIITIVATTAVKIDRRKVRDSKLEKDLKTLIDTTNKFIKVTDKRLNNIEIEMMNFNKTTDSYIKSLSINPNITKQQYYELTNGIRGLTEELKKNE
jgi:hypothetical protein